MALIKCPECGKEISDKAPACIHCGFPLSELKKEGTCKINGQEVDIIRIKELYNSLPDECKKIIYKNCRTNASKIEKYTCSCSPDTYTVEESNKIYDIYMDMKYPIQKQFHWFDSDTYLVYKFLIECIDHNFEYFEFNTSDYPSPVSQNQLRCPKCGSTSITTEEEGYSLLTGFWGASRKHNLCQKCGYRWWPGSK